jgi:3-hydroxyacyl-CoA dehydrogenase
MSITINKIAVIGSGVMGAGIAALAAGAGFEVLLLDIAPDKLNEKEEKQGLSLSDKTVKNRIVRESFDRICDPKSMMLYDQEFAKLISIGNLKDDFPKIHDCDLIIEAVVENMEIKQSLLAEIIAHAKPSAVIGSNTSGLCIGEISANIPAQSKARFMGTHFFNPPRFLRLLEIIPTDLTDKVLVVQMKEFFEKRFGKRVIIVKDTPDFVGNRIGTYAIGSLIKTARKYGYGVEKTDRLSGKIIGRANTASYKTADLVGIDLVKRVSENLLPHLTDKKEIEAQLLPDIIDKMLAKGLLGNKTKKGFYMKEQTLKGTIRKALNLETLEYEELKNEPIELLDRVRNMPPKEALQTLMYDDCEESRFLWDVTKAMLLNCANRIPEITEDYKVIDEAMKYGFNWEMGPFELWDHIGFVPSVQKMKAEEEEIPAWIQERADSSIPFYGEDQMEPPYIHLSGPTAAKYGILKKNEEAVLLDIGDEVACFQFRSKANSITAAVGNLLEEAIDYLESSDLKGIVIRNNGSHFSAGANLQYIYQLASESKWDLLEASVSQLQNICMKMKYAKKPIIFAPHGMTLGGGTEICLHGSKITALAETYMGLVEAGVGLLPASGGTKELLFRAMEGNKNFSARENVERLTPIFETVAMAKVSANAFDARNLGYISKTDRIIMNADYQVDEAKKDVLYLYDCGYRPRIPFDIKATGTTGVAALKIRIEFMKSAGYISSHDAVIAEKIAEVLAGGRIAPGTMISEEHVLDLEKERFLSLCGEEKTQARILHMLKTGKPLRN